MNDEVRNIVDYPNNFELMSHDQMIAMARERLVRCFEQRKNYQKVSSGIDLKLGDEVLLRVPHLSSNSDRVIQKFFHLYEGPYLIK